MIQNVLKFNVNSQKVIYHSYNLSQKKFNINTIFNKNRRTVYN